MGFLKPPPGSVYSTAHGKSCARCGHPATACRCSVEASPAAGPLEVRFETKGRKGKGVTVVSGVPLPECELKRLALRLKQVCGSGGTVKQGTIEIQGDHRERVRAELAAAGLEP